MAFQIESSNPTFQRVGFDRATPNGKRHESVNMCGPLVDSDVPWRTIYMLGGAESLSDRLPNIAQRAVRRAEIAITEAMNAGRDEIVLYRAQGSENRMPLGMQVLQYTKVALELNGELCKVEQQIDPLERGVYEILLTVHGLQRQRETTKASM